MDTTGSKQEKFRPIDVTIRDPGGSAIPDAHVRATYVYSGISSGATAGEDGTTSIPLPYCDKEPMHVEAVAPGYHVEAVNEYRPDKENYKLPLTLVPMKSEWDQVTVPLRASDQSGSINHPTVGRLQISHGNFHITNHGDVSVNGCVATWHSITIGKDYNLLMNDGTELSIRFLEIVSGFAVTFEHSPSRLHKCAA